MAERTSRGDPYAFAPLGDERTSRTQPPPPGGWTEPPPPVIDPNNLYRGQPVPAAGGNATYPQYPWGGYQPPPETPAPVTPAGPAAFAGSPLNTLYGIDSESYLTDDQRKLARMIQGKFDSSMDRRDRTLAQYGAPRLSSFVEDEALARAMALARGLNIPVQDALGMVGGNGPASRGGGGSGGGGPGGGSARVPTQTGTGRAPAAVRTVPPGATPTQAARWQQIMGGLTSILPLLIGKSGMDGLMKDGIYGWLKGKWNETFPEAAGNGTGLSDEMLDRVLDSQGANNSWDILPDPVAPAFIGDPEMGPPLWGDYTPGAELVGPPLDDWGGPEVYGYDDWLAMDPGSYWDMGADAGWGDFGWGDFGY